MEKTSVNVQMIAAIECSDFSDDYMSSIFPNEDSLAGTFKHFYIYFFIL